MLAYSEIDPQKKAFIFELDNVLIPERDYLLQVYYLFSNFLEYLETFPPANDLTQFFKKAYENKGPDKLFEKAREVFGFDEKYKANFERLHIEAKLPLKLLLYQQALNLLQEIVVDRKQIFIVTGGNPLQQLNKIKQTEWNGLEKYLRVYFVNEVAPKPSPEILNLILEEHKLDKKDVLLFGVSETDRVFARNANLDFVEVKY
ncbi:HAD hydrolase-like protein [Pedobacter sp. SYSU D00535]|uniref:HAD hydrolase-like protein n=1 Tax=Pedobacter sp. SYSU D00535 TaxID=2810308 RepID=UPI001A959BB2|nr:HAD hydrolase-like protein [Pedobacter sp. SYSU D00535]